MSCCRGGSDPALLWLYSSDSAPSLGNSMCPGCGLKRWKRKKERKKERERKEIEKKTEKNIEKNIKEKGSRKKESIGRLICTHDLPGIHISTLRTCLLMSDLPLPSPSLLSLCPIPQWKKK